jgi:hypothetical protein
MWKQEIADNNLDLDLRRAVFPGIKNYEEDSKLAK